MRKTSISSLSLLVALTSIGLLSACDDDEAEIRIVHASPGAPAVDVFAEGVSRPIAAGLVYGEASPYVDLATGDYNLIVYAAGTDTIVYETGLLALRNDDEITAVAVGDLELRAIPRPASA